MRKRTIVSLFDNAMWYILYMLPLLAFVILLFKGGTALTLSSAMTTCGLGVLAEGQIYVALNGLFGASGILPFFTSPDLLLYFTYFISVMLVHLAVDVLLFIPRYAHKLMDAFGGTKDE